MCKVNLCEKRQLAIVKQAISLTLKQGEISTTKDGISCMYRHNGLKCAVGQLIKDEHYCPHMEHKDVTEPVVSKGLSKSLGVTTIPKGLMDALVNLQYCHDKAVSDFKNSFIRELGDAATRSTLIKQACKELSLLPTKS